MMAAIVLRQLFAFLVAFSLLGGATMQFASSASAMSSTATQAASDPCEHMGGTAQGDQKQGPMPCDSVPCKGTLADCMQMCLASLPVLGLPSPDAVAPMLVSTGASVCWPADVNHPTLSIPPDPFPPKRLIAD